MVDATERTANPPCRSDAGPLGFVSRFPAPFSAPHLCPERRPLLHATSTHPLCPPSGAAFHQGREGTARNGEVRFQKLSGTPCLSGNECPCVGCGNVRTDLPRRLPSTRASVRPRRQIIAAPRPDKPPLTRAMTISTARSSFLQYPLPAWASACTTYTPIPREYSP